MLSEPPWWRLLSRLQGPALAILNYTEPHFVIWIKPMGSEICADEGPQAERCSLALALPAPPIPPHNMRAPTRSSREATENIVCLVLSHLREIYHCHFQSLSRPGFKLQEWHSHFYCSAYLGLLSALTKLIPCSGWSVLTFPPTLCWSLGLLSSTCFKQLEFRCWEKNQKSSSRGHIC